MIQLDTSGVCRAAQHMARYLAEPGMVSQNLMRQDRDWARFLRLVCPEFRQPRLEPVSDEA